MTAVDSVPIRVGWLGAGRMGVPMVERLLSTGHDVTVWNRTPEKLVGLLELGAKAAETPSEAARGDVVFSMIADDAALDALSAAGGLFDGASGPAVWVDCSTVSQAASTRAGESATKHGTSFVCAPVSGNPNVVRAGNVIFAVSGSKEATDRVEPLLAAMGRASHYVGDGHQARTVKLATNLLLGVTAQALAEVVVFAERSGVSR